jgi:hypothetical protein
MGRVVVIVFLLKTTIDRFQEDFRLYYQAHYWKEMEGSQAYSAFTGSLSHCS